MKLHILYRNYVHVLILDRLRSCMYFFFGNLPDKVPGIGYPDHHTEAERSNSAEKKDREKGRCDLDNDKDGRDRDGRPVPDFRVNVYTEGRAL